VIGRSLFTNQKTVQLFLTFAIRYLRLVRLYEENRGLEPVSFCYYGSGIKYQSVFIAPVTSVPGVRRSVILLHQTGLFLNKFADFHFT